MASGLYVAGLDVRLPQRELFTGLGLSVERDEVVAIMGPSGSGKTSLLKCIAGILKPNSGEIVINETELTAMSRGDLPARWSASWSRARRSARRRIPTSTVVAPSWMMRSTSRKVAMRSWQ